MELSRTAGPAFRPTTGSPVRVGPLSRRTARKVLVPRPLSWNVASKKRMGILQAANLRGPSKASVPPTNSSYGYPSEGSSASLLIRLKLTYNLLHERDHPIDCWNHSTPFRQLDYGRGTAHVG